jgi:hypothetical protein
MSAPGDFNRRYRSNFSRVRHMPDSMEKANEIGTGRIGHFVIIMTLISIVEEIGPLYATGSRTDPSCRAIRFLKNSLFSIAADRGPNSGYGDYEWYPDQGGFQEGNDWGEEIDPQREG